MKKLEIRGGKVITGGVDSPKGFHFYCDKNVGLLISDTFATVVYKSRGNSLAGRSVAVAKKGGGRNTARAVLVSDCGGDVLQRSGRDRVTAQVNYASDRLSVPASEVRPLFVGELIKKPNDEEMMQSIYQCAKSIDEGNTTDLTEFGCSSRTISVQFLLGDDYPCVLSGTVFYDKRLPMVRNSFLFTTDVVINKELLSAALDSQLKETIALWPIPSSANDGCMMLSSCLAGNLKIIAKDVEYAKFTKALEYVLTELCRTVVCGEERNSLSLRVVGAKSKRMAWDVVRNAYIYFMLSGNENASLVNGLISCIGSAGMLSKKKLQVWLQSTEKKLLLIDGGRILYFSEEILSEFLSMEELSLVVDFRESNYSACGWIRKEGKNVLFS